MTLICLSATLLFISLLPLLWKYWWIEILDLFRLQFAFVALLLTAVSVSQLNWIAALISAAALITDLYRIRTIMPVCKKEDTSGKDKAGSRNKRQIMSANVLKSNKKTQVLASVLQEAAPEVLLLLEMTPKLSGELSHILASYPYSQEMPVRDGHKMILLSKHPLKDLTTRTLTQGDTPLISARVTIDTTLFHLICIHPKPSFSRKWHCQRQEYFDRVADIVRKSDPPVILMGDFNSVPWVSSFRNFLKDTHLYSIMERQGFKITWPAFFLPAGLPFDHILLSQGVDFNSLQTGPFIGSDHYPVSIRLG